MKTIIATALVSLSISAPAFADVGDAKAFFALTNDSPAESMIGETSVGDPIGTAQTLAMINTSPAETFVNFDRARGVDVEAVQQVFALTNDSPAENKLR